MHLGSGWEPGDPQAVFAPPGPADRGHRQPLHAGPLSLPSCWPSPVSSPSLDRDQRRCRTRGLSSPCRLPSGPFCCLQFQGCRTTLRYGPGLGPAVKNLITRSGAGLPPKRPDLERAILTPWVACPVAFVEQGPCTHGCARETRAPPRREPSVLSEAAAGNVPRGAGTSHGGPGGGGRGREGPAEDGGH